MVDIIREQREGNYDRLRKNFKMAQTLFKQGKVINYICPKIYVKMTQEKGRGFFAQELLKQGDLLVVEKALAQAKQDVSDSTYSFQESSNVIHDGAETELVKKCS